jgi:hypothetical protein
MPLKSLSISAEGYTQKVRYVSKKGSQISQHIVQTLGPRMLLGRPILDAAMQIDLVKER